MLISPFTLTANQRTNLQVLTFICGVAGVILGLSAASSQSKLSKPKLELADSSDREEVYDEEPEWMEYSNKQEVSKAEVSTGRSAVDNFLWCIGLLLGAILIAVTFEPPYLEPTYRSLDVQTVKEELPTFATEISELVKFNNIPGDSKITSFVGESLAQSKVINSETQQSYLLDLPRVTSIKDGSANYVSVTGTVDDYTLTFSNPDLDIAATYTSKTGVTTLNDD